MGISIWSLLSLKALYRNFLLQNMNKLLQDVGLWISQSIKEQLSKQGKIPITLKYIDPTYMIRTIPSNASDNVCCTILARSAVHGATAGYTGFTSGLFNRITEAQNMVVIRDRMWARLFSSTIQPSFLGDKAINEVKKEERFPRQLLDDTTGSTENGTNRTT